MPLSVTQASTDARLIGRGYARDSGGVCTTRSRFVDENQTKEIHYVPRGFARA